MISLRNIHSFIKMKYNLVILKTNRNFFGTMSLIKTKIHIKQFTLRSIEWRHTYKLKGLKDTIFNSSEPNNIWQNSWKWYHSSSLLTSNFTIKRPQKQKRPVKKLSLHKINSIFNFDDKWKLNFQWPKQLAFSKKK